MCRAFGVHFFWPTLYMNILLEQVCERRWLTNGRDDGSDESDGPGEVPSDPDVVHKTGCGGGVMYLQQIVQVRPVDRGIGVEERLDCRVVGLTLRYLVVTSSSSSSSSSSAQRKIKPFYFQATLAISLSRSSSEKRAAPARM